MKETDPSLVKLELDIYWAVKAGKNPLDLFKAYPGRFPLWHVKDIDKQTGSPVELGKGFIDFKRIFDNASASGMRHFFIEQDGAPKPFENIANNLAYLKKTV